MTVDRGTGRRPQVALADLRQAVGLASLAYVSLPVAVFLVGWLWPGWAAVMTAALVAGLVAMARRFRAVATTPREERPVSGAAVAMGALAVVVVVGLSGPGGFGVQTWDWAKHNAILKDLVEQPWPVAYATGRDEVALTYYVAYYLPAALAGKLAGWRAANVALFAWTAIGCVLAMLWLVVLSGAPVWRCLAIFVLFSGLDVVGAIAWSSRWSMRRWPNDFHLEWWAGHWTYPGNVTLIAFAPHQATAGWLLTGLTIDGLRRYPARFPLVMAGGLGLLWSPFVTVGLMGFAALAWTLQPTHRETLSRMARDIANLAGAMIGLVVAFYLLSRYHPTGLPERYHTPPDRILAGALALVPGQMPWRDFVADYTVFVLLEFLVLAMLLAAIHRGRRADLRVLIAATIVLIVLPFLTYGRYNDLVMRASIPALFVLQLFAAQAPGVLPRRPLLHGAVVAVLVVGAAYPMNMLRLSAAAVVRRGALVRIPPRRQVADLFEQQLGLRERYFFIGQYVGALDSPFFRYLARQPVAVPKGPPATR